MLPPCTFNGVRCNSKHLGTNESHTCDTLRRIRLTPIVARVIVRKRCGAVRLDVALVLEVNGAYPVKPQN